MLTDEAIPILKSACKVPFKQLFAGHPEDLTTNKGHAGQLLERYIGLNLGNALTDFEDGELKTYKASPNADPLETIAVTQISRVIDDLLSDPHCEFKRSPLCKKLNNLLVVPVVKAGQCGDWYLVDVYQIDLEKNVKLLRQFADDYGDICRDLRQRVHNGQNIGTSNGRYIQVRTKASKPYRPIYSKLYGRNVASKNYAFYLQKAFMRDVIAKRI